MANVSCPFFDSRVTPTVISSADYGNHGGQDIIGVPKETAVVISPCNGTVVEGPIEWTYGIFVDVKVSDGAYAGGRIRMAHLAEKYVNPGDVVQIGTPIGLQGKTGNSLGADPRHLHIELRPGGEMWDKPSRPPESLVGFGFTSTEVVYTNTYIPGTSPPITPPDPGGGTEDPPPVDPPPGPNYDAIYAELQQQESTLRSQIEAAEAEKSTASEARAAAKTYKTSETKKLRAAEKELKKTDTTVNTLAGEILTGFQTLKQTAWETLVQSQNNQ